MPTEPSEQQTDPGAAQDLAGAADVMGDAVEPGHVAGAADPAALRPDGPGSPKTTGGGTGDASDPDGAGG